MDLEEKKTESKEDPNNIFKFSAGDRIFDFRAAEALCFTCMLEAVPCGR
jgi:hypothetical protein